MEDMINTNEVEPIETVDIEPVEVVAEYSVVFQSIDGSDWAPYYQHELDAKSILEVALAKIATSLHKNIVLRIHGNRSRKYAEISEDPTLSTLYIWSNFYPSLSTVFPQYSTEVDNNKAKVEELSNPIFDQESGVVKGLFFKDNVFILDNSLINDNKDSVDQELEIICNILSMNEEDLRKNKVIFDKISSFDAYKRYTKNRYMKAKETAEYEYNTVKQKIGNLMHDLIRAQRDRDVASSYLKYVENEFKDDGNVELEFKRMYAIPQFDRFELRGESTLIGHTNMIYAWIEDDQTWREFGEYKITLNLECSSPTMPVSFENKTRQLNYEGSTFHHPHIRDGYACLGNAEERIMKSFANKQFDQVFLAAIEYLEQAQYHDAWGKTVRDWPIASRDPDFKPVYPGKPDAEREVIEIAERSIRAARV